MTWVVAMPGLITGAAVVADVRITVRGPGRRVRTVEGVRKIHYIGPSMVLGFAGSIELGFRIVNSFRHYLSGIPEGGMARPGYVTWHFARRLRWSFAHGVPVEVKQAGCEIVVVGASPTERAIPARTHAWILRAPGFDLEPIPNLTARSVGSGSAIPEYVAALEELGPDPAKVFEVMQFETHFTGGSLMALSTLLGDAIEARREASVSEHLHLCFVRPDGVTLGTNDREGLTPGAPSRTMPPVATNLAEFRALAARHGFAAGAAIAGRPCQQCGARGVARTPAAIAVHGAADEEQLSQ